MEPPVFACGQDLAAGAQDRQAADRDSNVEALIGIQPGEPRRSHSDDLERMTIQPYGLTDHLRISIELALPEAVADDGHGPGGASAMTIVAVCKHAASNGWNTKHLERNCR